MPEAMKLKGVAGTLIPMFKVSLPRDSRGADMTNVLGHLDRVALFANEAIAAEARIDANPNLTPRPGRIEAKGEMAERMDAAVLAWHSPIDGRFAEHAAVLTNDLKAAVDVEPPKDAGWVTADMVLGIEIRRQVERLSPEGAEQLYRAGNGAIRRALRAVPRIATAGGFPRLAPWVSDEVVHQVLMEEGTRAKPDVAAQLHDVELARDAVRTSVNALRAGLRVLIEAARIERRLALTSGAELPQN